MTTYPYSAPEGRTTMASIAAKGALREAQRRGTFPSEIAQAGAHSMTIWRRQQAALKALLPTSDDEKLRRIVEA